MPIIQTSYRTSHIWKDAHFSTIYPSTLRKVTGIQYERERLELWDGDFLDLDWSKAGTIGKKVKSKKKEETKVEK